MILSSIKVELIDVMGNDLSVVNAARVSFAKVHKEFNESDLSLVRYLAEHGHWSPFAHPQLSFRIKAPIFVARQFSKHQVGLSWNEVSRRYVDDELEFFLPEMRARSIDLKQGSIDAIVPGLRPLVQAQYEQANALYKRLLAEGVAPEVARIVMPVGAMTEWIWTGSLYAFARVCKQRLAKEAQKEARDLAYGIYKALRDNFPQCTEALIGKAKIRSLH